MLPISVGNGDGQYVALVPLKSGVIGSTQNFASKYNFRFFSFGQNLEG